MPCSSRWLLAISNGWQFVGRQQEGSGQPIRHKYDQACVHDWNNQAAAALTSYALCHGFVQLPRLALRLHACRQQGDSPACMPPPTLGGSGSGRQHCSCAAASALPAANSFAARAAWQALKPLLSLICSGFATDKDSRHPSYHERLTADRCSARVCLSHHQAASVLPLRTVSCQHAQQPCPCLPRHCLL